MAQKFIPGETYATRGGWHVKVARINADGTITDANGCCYWPDGRVCKHEDRQGDLMGRKEELERYEDARRTDRALNTPSSALSKIRELKARADPLAMLKAAILDAQIRAFEQGRLDTPDEINANAVAAIEAKPQLGAVSAYRRRGASEEVALTAEQEARFFDNRDPREWVKL